jgi:DNA invertase Pin-like site-specific DNA recombinase
MLACSYDRVSTGRQASKTDLNTRYLKAIQAHCDRNGWPLRRRFTDPGLSGKNAARPGMQRAIQWAIKHKGVIVFYDLSRFSRSLPDLVSIAQELRKHGAALSSCTEAIDLRDDNPAAELQFHILAACAQFMRRLTSKKVKERNARTVEERGHRTNGVQPAGYKLINGRRVECPEEQAVLAIIRDLWLEEGYEPHEIAAALSARRVPTIRKLRGYKHAKPWTEATVRGLQESMPRPRCAAMASV